MNNLDDLLDVTIRQLIGLSSRVADLERQEPPSKTRITAWKSHRVANLTFALANTWTDVPWDTKVADECLPGIGFLNEGGPGENTAILVVDGIRDILYCGGCVRPLWTGTPGTRVIVASRIVISSDAGDTWREARCLQSVTERQAQANEVGTQHYLGSVLVDDGTWIKLQVRVGNTSMQLAGWPTFDNPVSASMLLHGIGGAV